MPVCALPATPTPTVNIRYELGWDGSVLFGTHERPVALDTETSIDNDIDPTAINRLALIQASDGARTILIHPTDLAKFLDAHQDVPFVGHNIAGYDFWVIVKALQDAGLPGAVEAWWEKADRGLLHDSMLLDMLVRLAEGKGETGGDTDGIFRRGLGVVAKEYAGIELNKSDPYRKRYVEIIGKKFSEVRDTGFWEYAAKDAYASAHLWPPLYRKARSLMTRFAQGLGHPVTPRLARWEQYGVLTEQIQIKAAIAISQIERDGMPYSVPAAQADEAKWRTVLDEKVKELDAMRPSFFRKKNGRFEMTKKALTPSIVDPDLIQALSEAALKIKEAVPAFETPQSDGVTFQKTGDAISKAGDDWTPWAAYDPFIAAWSGFSEAVKRLGFYSWFKLPPRTLFSDLEPEVEPRVRASINTLVRTGRVSHKDPNLAQAPRDADFRAVFQCRPGKKLLTIDYSFVELRTLAATCIDLFGYSVLGDTIKAGKDPHVYTAALINGMTYETFADLKKTNPAKYKADRQSAKALNFGIPGGLGARNLVGYAAKTYGVVLSLDEAETFRRKIINEVYPELNDRDGYLADQTYQAIAMNTGLSKSEVVTALPGSPEMRGWLGRVIGRIAQGASTKADGDPYNPRFYGDCWDFLEGIGRKAPKDGPLTEATRKKLLLRQGDSTVSRELTMATAVTLTGRVRAKVRFTANANTKFQGLAADGIKLAMFDLARRGYRVCSMVHDELVIELDEATAAADAEIIKKVMCEAMESVFVGGVPCDAEYHLEDRWVK